MLELLRVWKRCCLPELVITKVISYLDKCNFIWIKGGEGAGKEVGKSIKFKMNGNKTVNCNWTSKIVCADNCFKIFVCKRGKGMGQSLKGDRMSKKVLKRWEILEHVYLWVIMIQKEWKRPMTQFKERLSASLISVKKNEIQNTNRGLNFANRREALAIIIWRVRKKSGGR